jgi:hypothetical protein
MAVFLLGSKHAVFAFVWSSMTKSEVGAHQRTSDIAAAFFMMFQVLMTGGYDDTIQHLDQRVVFAVAVVGGITLISVLIGLITDSVPHHSTPDTVISFSHILNQMICMHVSIPFAGE